MNNSATWHGTLADDGAVLSSLFQFSSPPSVDQYLHNIIVSTFCVRSGSRVASHQAPKKFAENIITGPREMLVSDCGCWDQVQYQGRWPIIQIDRETRFPLFFTYQVRSTSQSPIDGILKLQFDSIPTYQFQTTRLPANSPNGKQQNICFELLRHKNTSLETLSSGDGRGSWSYDAIIEVLSSKAISDERILKFQSEALQLCRNFWEFLNFWLQRVSRNVSPIGKSGEFFQLV